jgi:quercetin dioxygenase-like cupin family protein
MFGKKSYNGYSRVLEGIEIKTLVHGRDTLMTEFRLTKDSALPEHAHEQEQTGYLVKGKIRLFIDGASQVITPGDSWMIPSNVRHRAEILQDSVALEVFSPCRSDYLKYMNAEDVV